MQAIWQKYGLFVIQTVIWVAIVIFTQQSVPAPTPPTLVIAQPEGSPPVKVTVIRPL